MKILNEPIKVMVIFNCDGKIEPVKFKLGDQVVRIQKVLKTYEEKVVSYNRLVFLPA
jgi:hypothetical protein